MKSNPKNKGDSEAMLNAKAWKDPKFKKKLLKDPHAAIEEMGFDIPPQVKIRIVEEDADTVIFVLHPAPRNQPMAEEELQQIAGGQDYNYTDYGCKSTGLKTNRV